MKIKILIFLVLTFIIISCSPKTIPMIATPKVADVKVTKAMTSELAEGMYLYENNCAKCHKLYSPKDFNEEEWKPIVNRMQKKAHLTDLEGQKIYNYLTMK